MNNRLAKLTAVALSFSSPALADFGITKRTDLSTIASFNVTIDCTNASISASRMFDSYNNVQRSIIYYTITNTCQNTVIAAGGGWLPDTVFVGDPRKHEKLTLTIDSADPALLWWWSSTQGQPFVASITWRETKTHVSDASGASTTVDKANNLGRHATFDETHERSAAISGTTNLFTLDNESTGLLQWSDTTYASNPS